VTTPKNPSKPGPKRTPEQREADLAKTAAWYLKGVNMVEIGRRLGLSRVQVSYDIKHLHAMWKESALRDFDAMRSEQLAKVDQLEAVYWDGYERSLSERTRERVAQTTGTAATGNAINTSTMERTVELRDGAIAWLQGVERCINMRCKLLGLNELERQAAGVLAKAYAGFDFEAI
jgi:hypothetical protein